VERNHIETLNDTTRAQIMFVIHEAAGVSDRVFEVAEGALASPNSSLLMGGNPTRGTGYFAPPAAPFVRRELAGLSTLITAWMTRPRYRAEI
jgi:hypothetical protein